MGAGPARITGADFLTPPEFRALRLAAEESGRVGGVRLELRAADGFTRPGAWYQQVPLRVLPPFQFGAGRPALLYLLNPTAGLFDGDAQLVEVVARAGTQVVIVGQSATRVHPTPRGFSTQQWRIRVEAGATVVVLPGPTIPFRDCRCYQRVEVELEAGAGFVWGDVWLAGRYARGAASERFAFAALIQEVLIRRRGELVFRDRFHWRGPWDEDAIRWHCGGAPAWGSLFAVGSPSEAAGAIPAGTSLAHFATACGDTCLRWTGSSEAVIAAVVRSALRLAPLYGKGGHDAWSFADNLAPAHWFTACS